MTDDEPQYVTEVTDGVEDVEALIDHILAFDAEAFGGGFGGE